MAKAGDKVKIHTKDKVESGILMPTESDDCIFIKLASGYNKGIKKSAIKKTEVVSQKKELKTINNKLPSKKGFKNILIVHTGGTIASKVDYETGGVVAKLTANDLVEMVPVLKRIANIDCEVVANMMSEDINFHDYAKIINGMKKCVGNCDGIIIGHGTDTLTYTAAALSFAFVNPHVPILLVGSQRSSDRPSSDAGMNLICAAQFIANSDFKGVAICMHNSSSDDKCAILPATKTRKMHTTRRDAFKAINDTPIALVDTQGNIDYQKEILRSDEKPEVKEKFSEKVALVKSHPNINTKLLEFLTKNYEAIVIEATGLGNLPIDPETNKINYKVIKSFIEKGGILAITSQCIYGRVHPMVYASVRRLSEIGAIFCEDMLSETAYIKLSWLLGNFNKEKSKELLNKNLRGEITKRSKFEEDFLA